MAFITRTNGSGAQNLINADWWNSIQRIFTGTDADQPINIHNSVTLTPWSPPPAPTLTAAVGGGTVIGIGTYYYQVAFVNSDGRVSPLGVSASVITNAVNSAVAVSNIPLGPAGTVARKLYRSKANGSTATGSMFLLATINDNTTTTYGDITPDASLTTLDRAPLIGSLIFNDATGAVQGFIDGDATIGRLQISGNQRIELIIQNGTNLQAYIDGSGMWLLNVLHLAASGSTPGVIQVGTGGFGVKNSAGTKLFEAKNNGNAVISGTQYQTSASSIGTASGQSFDSFDVAELFECDQPYASGTVVCPGNNNLLSQCTHENCPCAMVISSLPGFLLGASDNPNALPIAMSGRVDIQTNEQVQPRDLVVSNGQGGVRTKQSTEQGHVIGFALNVAQDGSVGVFLRSLYA